MIQRAGVTALAFLVFASLPQPGAAQTIHDAVQKGDLAAVKALLAADPSRLNSPGERGQTPLAQSIMSKSGEIFAYLLERGADIEKPDGNGLRPLDFAVFGGLEEWADRLLDLGADVNAHGNAMGMTPLHMAVRGGRSGLVERLLAAGARLDIRDGSGDTPLLTAAGEGRSEIVGRLLAAGALVDDRDDHGSTALHLACLNGHRAAVESLIAARAPLQVKNAYGSTPWSISKREGFGEIAALLQAAGATEDGPVAPLPEGAYLGQKPPGSHPVLFAPGVVSTEKKELNSVFTPNGREFYFTIQDSQGRWTIMVMSRAGESWTPPRPASFSGSYSDVDLFITPDGKKLYFCSNRPAEGTGAPKRDFDIWVVDRNGGEWGPPRNPGPPIHSDANEYYPALTRDGTLYFQSQRPGGRGAADIYRARLQGGAYREVENLGEAINSPGFEGDALIAPDESFLIVSVDRPGGFGRGDLHISFRRADGAWSPLMNMGEAVNTKDNENCPILSPDGTCLFFTRAGDIWWVDAGILTPFREKAGAADNTGRLSSAGPRAPLGLTYVANMGVLVASGGTKVLIDALFDRPNPEYRAPTPETLEKVIKGETPYDGVKLVLVTHNHPDHFAPGVAVRFLESRPDVVLAAPADAVAELRQASSDWSRLESRVISIDLEPGDFRRLTAAGIPVTAVRTLHSGDRDSPMNLMYLFEIGGRRIFHEGDSNGKPDVFKGIGLESAPLDLAVLHYWFPLEPNMSKYLQEVFQPDHIALGHLPIRLESDAPGKIDLVRQYYKDLRLLLPGMPPAVIDRRSSEGDRLPAGGPPPPANVLVLLGEWFGDAYFPLQAEIESRGWAQKRVGVDVEYRGCYNKKRDVVLRSDILIPDLKDFSGYDAVIIPSGPQFRKLNLNPVVLDFLKDAHAAGLLIASFCTGNFVVEASGLLGRPLGEDLFPKQVAWIGDRILIGPRGGGPPPGDGFESAPVKEVCEAVARKLESRAARPAGPNRAALSGIPGADERWPIAQALREGIGWAKNKDFRLLYDVIADDADFLEVHPDGEAIKGIGEFRKAESFWGSPDFKAVRFEIRDLRITLSKKGDTSWFYCLLDDINEWKGQPANWENTRWTGVLEKRNGRWVVVQQHFSFAAKS